MKSTHYRRNTSDPLEAETPSSPYDEEVHSLIRPRKSGKENKHVEDDLDNYNRLVHVDYVNLSSRSICLLLAVVILIAILFGSLVAELRPSRVSTNKVKAEEIVQNVQVRFVTLPMTTSLTSFVQSSPRLSIMNAPLPADFLKGSRLRFAIALRAPWRRAAAAISTGHGGLSAARDCRQQRRSGSNTNATVRALEYRDCASACIGRVLLGRRCLGPHLTSTEHTEALRRLDAFDFVADAERWHSALFAFAAKFDFALADTNAFQPYSRIDQSTDSWIADLYRGLPFEDDQLYQLAQTRMAAELDAITSALLRLHPLRSSTNDPLTKSLQPSSPQLPPTVTTPSDTYHEYPGLFSVLGKADSTSILVPKPEPSPPPTPSSQDLYLSSQQVDPQEKASDLANPYESLNDEHIDIVPPPSPLKERQGHPTHQYFNSVGDQAPESADTDAYKEAEATMPQQTEESTRTNDDDDYGSNAPV